MKRRTKIIATIGPASDDERTLKAMIDAGMDVARINLSHGGLDTGLERYHRLRQVASTVGRPIGALVDLPGPKVRSGAFPEGGSVLHTGDEVELVAGQTPSDEERITVDESHLTDCVATGDSIVLGDGTVSLEVLDVEGDVVRARVRNGGRVQGRPGVHLPSEHWAPPVPTDDDLRLIKEVGGLADWVAVSFVRRAEELIRVREALGPRGPKLMAKIETRSAVEHLDDLLVVADGVMVARGDLGIDFPIEDVPVLQKQIISACAARGVPVVTATQMLESMISAATPTRAEATDVANAVVDGTDALMLSAETAIGVDPANVVRTMARIAERAEQSDERRIQPGDRGRVGRRQPTAAAVTVAMAHAAYRAASELDLAAIVCCTRNGVTARAMAALRPPCRLVGASPSCETARQLSLSWGVEPLVVGEYETTDEMVWCVVEAAVQRGLVSAGETIAVLAGAPDSPTRGTDVLRVVAVC